MADLIAKFQLIDDMSDKLGMMADRGAEMLDRFDMAGQAADNAFGSIEGAATQVAHSIDGVSACAESYGNSMEAAGNATDYWTNAIGSYDKSALEAVYSTEELVEMGFKSAAALEEQERMLELCEQQATSLNRAIEASADIHSELSATIENTSEAMSGLLDHEKVSGEAKEALARASDLASEAMRELEAAQTEAQAAMENYHAVINSGVTDLDAFEAAGERACYASETLAEANEKAATATEELSRASDTVAEESEKAGESGVDAINSIATALAAAGITATIKEIAEAAFELTEAFSEAESTVVMATGAAGEALDGLMESTMNAYSAAKNADLSSTAGAIGEINTRMALTGEALTEVTGKFLDFASITGTDVVGSVQDVTKIMNKWNVESSEVESVLDKIAYTAQVSGISVNTLTSNLITGAASFQEMGFSLDNTISLLGKFELYGMNGTTAITAMRTAAKNFSDDGLDAQMALQSVIEKIAYMENAADATALAVDTFGSRAGVDMANAIRSGELSVDAFNQSLEVAEGTLAATAMTAQTLDQKWQQASNNIKTAFTTAIEPSISKTSSSFAEFMNGIGDYLNEHPRFTKAITAVAIGLGTVAVGIAGVSFATTVAIPAISAFGVALNASLGPIGWVALAIAGVVAAGSALIAMFSESTDVSDNMTMRTRAQYNELQSLNEQYERACESYGRTSEQAGELALQISQLEQEYNSTGETIGEFTVRIEEMGAVIESTFQTYEEAVSSADELYNGSVSLASQLLVLSNQSDITGATFDTMAGIVDKLNGNYGDLGLTIDKTTGKLNYSVSDLYDFISKAADEQKQAAAMDGLVQSLEQFGAVKEASVQASQEVAAAWDNYEALEEKWQGEHPILKNLAAGAEMNWSSELGEAFDEFEALSDAADIARNNYDMLVDNIRVYCEQLGYTSEETEELISQIVSSAEAMGELSGQMGEAGEQAEAIAIAYEDVRAEIEELCAAYDEAYQSALESFSGQFGLFDQAEADMEATVSNAQAALDSQLAYWDSYLNNVEVLRNTSAEDLGITQENYDLLMQYAQDGSEQAAGLAASMVEAIQSGDEEAIAALANTAGEVAGKQQEVAAATADWVVNFTAQMDGIEQKMQSTVEEMNLSGEAEASATATINAYAKAIRAGKDGAVAAAKEVAAAVSAALSSAQVSNPGSPVIPSRGYASGTLDAAPGLALVGEDGPELINFRGGEVVYTADETERILGAYERPLDYTLESKNKLGNESPESSREDRTIILRIEGAGELRVDRSVDKQHMADWFLENARDVFLSIIQQEIFEEGDLAYEF